MKPRGEVRASTLASGCAGMWLFLEQGHVVEAGPSDLRERPGARYRRFVELAG